MKKWLLLSAFLLAACSDSESVYTTFEKESENEPKQHIETKEEVQPTVQIHSPNGVSHGYVVHVDQHKKYIVTVASAVSSHPNALIKTSTGQIVEGEVIGVNKEDNIAILFTKLTASIEAFEFAEEMKVDSSRNISEAMIDEEKLLAITTVVKEGTSFHNKSIASQTIVSLLNQAMEDPMSYKERLELKEYFAEFSTVMVEEENVIENYEKDTFHYNPDELLLFINEFHDALNRYFETKSKEELSPFVVSDDLKQTIAQIAESGGGKKQFGAVKLTSTTKADFQYIVKGKTSLTVDDEVGEIEATYKCITMNGKWKIVSVTYK